MNKRLLISIIIVTCVTVGLLTSDKAKASKDIYDRNEYIINTPYQYPIVPETEEWKNLGSLTAMINATHIDYDILKNMSTPALVETVVSYPLFVNVCAYDTLEKGVNEVSKYFYGIEELCNRENARSCLLNFINSRCPNLLELKTDEEIKTALYDYEKAYNDSRNREIFFIINAVTLIEYLDYSNKNTNNTRYSADYVYTPMGYPVSAIYGYTIWDHATPTYAQQLNNQYHSSYPNAVELASINGAYNCHSYAWHQQSTSNNYWINYPEMTTYLTDGSYSSSNPAVGRRIIYRKSDGEVTHSGIISAISDTTYITSKWGYCGLYYHKINECPYYSNNINISYWKLN